MRMRRLPRRFAGLGNGNGSSFSPAPTPDSVSAAAGTSLSPITLVSPVPSITAAGPTQVSSAAVPAAPTGFCAVENWVNQNPGLAALAGVGLFFLIKGGGAK